MWILNDFYALGVCICADYLPAVCQVRMKDACSRIRPDNNKFSTLLGFDTT